ncbi:MAG: tail fiber domain-containing protein [Nitrospirae bacterium]|nr:tail fiber domain-containing protein [Nitrospirota bacterium]
MTEALRITETQNIGIGTTNPGAYKLYVNGNVYVNGTVTQTSDIRYKENITTIQTPLDKILNMRGVLYSWKTEEYKDKGFSEGRHYGVIGQEVEKVLPDIVKEGEQGEKGVSYIEIIPVLIEAVKEQQRVIEELKAEVRQLKTKGFVAKAQ